MRKIRAVITGLGNIAHKYEENFWVTKRMKYPTHFSVLRNSKKFNLVAAHDNQKEARIDFSKKTVSVKMYSDFGEMLEKERPELLIVTSPTETHYEICRIAINKSVPAILCEKPISFSLFEGRKLVKLARDKKIIIVFNYNRAFNKKYNLLADKIKSKHWGKVLDVEVTYTKGILNNASHAINLLVKFFGPVSKVRGLKLIVPNHNDPTLNFSLNFGKCVACFHGLGKKKHSIFKMDIFFEKARLKFTNDILEEFRMKKNGNISTLEKYQSSKPNNYIEYGLFDVYDNIYNHITSRCKLLSTPEEALYTLEVASKVISILKK